MQNHARTNNDKWLNSRWKTENLDQNFWSLSTSSHASQGSSLLRFLLSSPHRFPPTSNFYRVLRMFNKTTIPSSNSNSITIIPPFIPTFIRLLYSEHRLMETAPPKLHSTDFFHHPKLIKKHRCSTPTPWYNFRFWEIAHLRVRIHLNL